MAVVGYVIEEAASQPTIQTSFAVHHVLYRRQQFVRRRAAQHGSPSTGPQHLNEIFGGVIIQENNYTGRWIVPARLAQRG